ncbi:hypothetical protein BAJUN_01820 [Bajunvirus bajun]|uniref:Uncharacterized protein n=1 Tax=Brevundimonas phage vB_BgoS-Bajun TaxID=2948594 RepID=A0A9E7SUV2_9CAUD|nr:hypothetical protein BAJUN_01820 [Brevundimonas phage vB_BgoS-Bajun]
MTTTPNFSTPSLAVAFFASAGGAAFLKAVLDLRAATVGIDDEPDISNALVIEIGAAKNALDDVIGLLAEAGVQIVIAAPGVYDNVPQSILDAVFNPPKELAAAVADINAGAALKTTLEPGDIGFAQASGYGIGPASETGDGREGFCFFAPDGRRSAAFTLQLTAWLAAVREVEGLPYAVGEHGLPPLARFATEAEGAAYIDTLDPVKREAGGYYLDGPADD